MTKENRQDAHPGGEQKFWRDEIVKKYEYQQHLLSEKKDELLANITRIIYYFCQLRLKTAPKILDIGCGPGTTTTLSSYILAKVPNSIVVGVDSSEQIVEAANANLIPQYAHRFSGFVGDFNSDKFWASEIDKKYDFITSNGALHYLADQRMSPFLKEIFNHLENGGILVACLANRSMFPQISDMEDFFRIEFTYNQIDKSKRPTNFQKFRKEFEVTDRKANINWHGIEEWRKSIKTVGFNEVDIVWHLWVRSIFVAIK